MRRRTIVLSVVAAIAVSPAAADADVLVAYDHVVSGQGFNIAVKNLQQDGANVTLPAGINTAANEFHPTLSGDGQFLTFQRDTLANTPAPRPRLSTTSRSSSSTCTPGGSSRRPRSSSPTNCA